jgi:hypothetical protein
MDNFYVQLALAILVVASLVVHKLHWDKTAALVDQVKGMLGGK